MRVEKYVGQAISAAAASVLLAFAGLAAPADADGAIVGLMSEQDSQVLAEFDTRRATAIATATAFSDEAAVATLTQVLAAEAQSFDGEYDPSGDWRCRFLKLGGDPALTVYGWFACRIYDDGAGWVLQKTTGSQRSKGRLYRLTDERLLYLGALHFGYDDPIWFGDDPSRNHIAVLTRLDDGRMLLEFPAPLAESKFDILELSP
jgi:hypothetical protein